MDKLSQVMAIAAAHHRFSYIHPFLDGNGRVSRLLSHAMAMYSGIGVNGVWSISRGLARGLQGADEYKKRLHNTDSPRQGDTDGRGNLSLKELISFTDWFLATINQHMTIMSWSATAIGLNYAPFSISASESYWTSTTSPSSSVNAIRIVNNTSIPGANTKTSTNKYLYCRKWIPSDFGL